MNYAQLIQEKKDVKYDPQFTLEASVLSVLFICFTIFCIVILDIMGVSMVIEKKALKKKAKKHEPPDEAN